MVAGVSFVETKRQLELQGAAREVVERVVTPLAAAVRPGDKLTADQLRQIYKALAPLGYPGSTIGKEFGVAMEEAKASAKAGRRQAA
jgi:alkylation response protein AidB-like acyl-CoA dehydrogenase